MDYLSSLISRGLTTFDPTQFSFTVLVFLVVTGAMVFINRKLWPFLTEQYWPQKVKQYEARFIAEQKVLEAQNNIMADLRDAVVGMKALVQQLILMNQNHDNEARETMAALASKINNWTGDHK